MTKRSLGFSLCVGLVCFGVSACGGDDSKDGSGGSTAGGGAGGATGGSAGTSSGGSAGVSGGLGGTGGATSCTSARDALINPVDKISTGTLSILDQAGGVTTIYVNASAGGFAQAATNPYVYLQLSDTSKVDISDTDALTSTGWDMALKRDVIRTNSGDSGTGSGGAARVSGKAFDAVTAADAASFDLDEFLDDQCNSIVDATGKPQTAFTDWYNYDEPTMYVSPKALVWVVRAADGATLYKLEILDYYALQDGGTGTLGAFYKIRVAPL